VQWTARTRVADSSRQHLYPARASGVRGEAALSSARDFRGVTAHRNFESTAAIAGSGILPGEGCLIGVSLASGLGENERRGDKMLKLALFFFIVSIIAGVFGFTGISVAAAGIAKVLFFIFLIAFVVLLVLGLVVGSAIF
jgi:uncharacterized membrane protein YtjA (UPF0391 family)